MYHQPYLQGLFGGERVFDRTNEALQHFNRGH
jgi:hypothetical protein